MNKRIKVESNDGQIAWLRIEGLDDPYILDRGDTPDISVADFLTKFPPGQEIVVENYVYHWGQAQESEGGIA